MSGAIGRVLIANRGEIALRAARACRSLGIGSVAVHSTADAASPHVWVADEAVCIGPPPSRESYLNVDRLLHVAKARGCDAVYPGYGFLAENAGFAERCGAEGLTFIGPEPESIRLMGDKAAARAAAMRCGVPVVPGSEGAFESAGDAQAAAAGIGYPMLLKARAGGGGRGMRIVETEAQFLPQFAQAAREAAEAFGDAGIYLERFVPRVRHIEVQVFGDGRGNVRQLGERDCTVQRRHQKLVEEALSPALSPAERAHVLSAAVRLAEGVNYRGAGTVEFIFDPATREAYFIEMNTRIQVEHPVTEMLIGADLVAEQLRVAGGAELSVEPPGPGAGHAIEFRINAEDFAHDFRPSPGRIAAWRAPSGAGIRLDGFVGAGSTVVPFYDSMIAKLVVHGADREEALSRARTALNAFRIGGVRTTVDFHRALLEDPDFAAGEVHTKWVEQSFLPRRTGSGT